MSLNITAHSPTSLELSEPPKSTISVNIWSKTKDSADQRFFGSFSTERGCSFDRGELFGTNGVHCLFLLYKENEQLGGFNVKSRSESSSGPKPRITPISVFSVLSQRRGVALLIEASYLGQMVFTVSFFYIKRINNSDGST